MLLMFTREHANIFKVVEENHLTKKQGCVYTSANVIFHTLVYFAIIHAEEQAENKEVDLNFLEKTCLKYLFHSLRCSKYLSHNFEQSVCTASAPSAFG